MLKNRSGFSLFSLAGACVAILLVAATELSPAWAEEEIPARLSPPVAESAVPADVSAEIPDEMVAEHAEKKEKLGFPQLNTATYPSQIFWLFVSFAILYALMSKIALPRINEVLDMRQSQRDGNLHRAEHLNREAEAVQTAYAASLAKAQTAAQEDLARAEDAISEKLAAENARFMENARKRIAAAEQGIAKAREEALGSLADISAEVAAEMVAKIADVQVSKADAKKVVMTEMQKG